MIAGLDPAEDAGAERVAEARDDALDALAQLAIGDVTLDADAIDDKLKSAIGELLAARAAQSDIDPDDIDRLIDELLDARALYDPLDRSGLEADIDEIETGMVHINSPTIGGEAQLPFGGIKATGVGDREMAEEGLNFFTELKTVWLDYTGRRRETNIY